MAKSGKGFIPFGGESRIARRGTELFGLMS